MPRPISGEIVISDNVDNCISIYLILYIKIKSKWIKDLNIRAKVIKLLKENKEVNLCDLGLDNGFLDATPKARATKK